MSAAEHLANAEAAEGLAAMMQAAGAATLGDLFPLPNVRGSNVTLTDDHEQVAADMVDRRGPRYARNLAEDILDAIDDEAVPR